MKFIFAFLLLVVVAQAATYNSDGSASDVQAKMNLATGDGDIVTIPAGTFNWAISVTWAAPANATLIGAGTSDTGGGDQTIIVDDFNSASPLLTINIAATGTFRMTGITFRTNDNDPVKENGEVIINGPGSIRVDHCHFDNHTNSGATNAHNVKVLWVGNGLTGVIDSCIHDFYGVSSIYIANGAGASGVGNEVWAEATNFGGSDFIFFEDNLYRATVDSPVRIGDIFSGGRTVWRFNTIQGGAGMEVHATGYNADGRGARAAEGYGNSFTILPSQAFPPRNIADVGSGTMLLWGNGVEPEALQNMFLFNVTRKSDAPYAQAATPTGWGYAGTAFNGTGSNWDGNVNTSLGYPCLDQPGRGVGQLLVGSAPTKTNSSTGTIAWPNQALEPVYIFKNEGLSAGLHPGYGGSVYGDLSAGRVVANRDYYPQASGIQTTPSSPFDGTVGVGWGTLANRPTTCTTGVAYWATDQGSWNRSSSNPQGVQQNGADGVLYVATATNTWTLYYEPYTYPHPLRNTNQVSEPQFSPAAGSYATAQNVTITTGTSGATIRYTTDGSTPTNSYGTVYSTPVSIPSTVALKAIAYNGVLDDSIVTTGVYNIGGSAGDGVVTGTSTVTTTLTLP